tara:strand:+ start:7034 stop:7924 length:891 start_codon:yes stop_codon:yes gene_type:complete
MSIIVSANIDTFLQSADNAAARTNLGVDAAPTAVADNDAKQLLTNLSDGQEVEVTGEAGRIERFNGDQSGDNFQGRLYVQGGTFQQNQAGAVINLTDVNDIPITVDLEHMAATGAYIRLNNPLHGFDAFFFTNDAFDGAGGTANKWGILDQYYAGNIIAESVEDSSTVHPADATWVAIGDGVTAPTVTRAPEAEEQNWYAIKNTVYLTVQEGQFAGPFVFNGVTVGSFSTVGVGWVPVCEVISVDVAAMWAVSEINGDTTFQNEHTQTGTTHVFTVGTDVTLADCFPSGALVKIIN